MSELRELDQQFAFQVMGWRRELDAWYSSSGEPREDCQVPPYSSDIAAAMEVLEQFKLWQISRSDHPSAQDSPYLVMLYSLPHRHASFHKRHEGTAKTLPEAVCLAALECVKEKAKVSS